MLVFDPFHGISNIVARGKDINTRGDKDKSCAELSADPQEETSRLILPSRSEAGIAYKLDNF